MLKHKYNETILIDIASHYLELDMVPEDYNFPMLIQFQDTKVERPAFMR